MGIGGGGGGRYCNENIYNYNVIVVSVGTLDITSYLGIKLKPG